jgi:hypothetical protein
MKIWDIPLGLVACLGMLLIIIGWKLYTSTEWLHHKLDRL